MPSDPRMNPSLLTAVAGSDAMWPQISVVRARLPGDGKPDAVVTTMRFAFSAPLARRTKK